MPASASLLRNTLTDATRSPLAMPSADICTTTAGDLRGDIDRQILAAIPDLARVVAHYFRTPESREDMMQDVVTHLMLKYAAFSGRSPFLHWALKITSNLCISKLRSNKLRRFLSLDTQLECEPASSGKGQTQQLVEQENIRLLNTCMDRLKPREREILILSDFMRKNDEEVAAILVISAVNVRVRRHRARMKLKELLLQEGYSHE